MTRLYKIVRVILLVAVTLCIGIPTGLYLCLSTPWAQDFLRKTGEEELTKLLGTEVAIAGLDIAPFNRIRLHDVSVADDNGKQALKVSSISARFELTHFLSTGNIVIDYVALDSLTATLYRPTADSPLNISGIISRLTKKDPDKEPSRFDLAISTVLISNSSATYDVRDKQTKEGRFDPNHIDVQDLNVAAYLPILSNEKIVVELEQLAFAEQSGLTLKDMSARVIYTPESIAVNGLSVELPHSGLYFGNIFIPSARPDTLVRTTPLTLVVADSSHVRLSDLAPFVPQFKGLGTNFKLAAAIHGTTRDVTLDKLTINSFDRRIRLSAEGTAHSILKRDSISVENLSLRGHIATDAAMPILGAFNVSPEVQRIAGVLGAIDLDASVSGTPSLAEADVTIVTSAGRITATTDMHDIAERTRRISGTVDIEGLALRDLTNKATVDNIYASAGFDLGFGADIPIGEMTMDIARLTLRETELEGIHVSVKSCNDGRVSASVSMEDPTEGYIDLRADALLANRIPVSLNASGTMRNVYLTRLLPMAKYDGYALDTELNIDLNGDYRTWLNGFVHIKGLSFRTNDERPSLKVDNFKISADNSLRPNTITIASDFLNGRIDGDITLATLIPQCKDLISHILPSFITPDSHRTAASGAGDSDNHFVLELTFSDVDSISKFLKLPVGIVAPVNIDGSFDYTEHQMMLSVDAPFLLQGNKIIEHTALQATIDGQNDVGNIYATSTIPTQKGTMVVVTGMTASENRVDTRIDWNIEREKPINGDMSFSTLLGRDDAGRFTAEVSFNPGDITFGDAVWHISPSRIGYASKRISVENFALSSDAQSIHINGVASEDSNSLLTLDISNLHLISIFETLDINKALIGGQATGTFKARGLFGTAPELICDRLHVDNISYNYCDLGTGDILAYWDNEKKSFALDADIVGRDGRKSQVRGDIFATREALDIDIYADRVPVGFMKPFMSAFADDVTGFASGHARLYGTFKNIDLEADVYAQDLGLKIGFTNTWYYASDSVIIAPGQINVNDITINDAYGHTARVSGFVKHNFFHDPVFEFRITQAEELLCYDVTPKLSPDWYGRIFGNGGAVISGEPGLVNINVNMSTAPNSTFTFVLSDAEEADDYTFITFRDKKMLEISDSIVEQDPLPQAVRDYRERVLALQNRVDAPSVYKMDIQVDITPAAKMIIVMDPVGGDEIKGTGSGNLRMTYESPGNELHMYGNYTIERGSYNFTLQDIIVKDFTIDEGSSITFTGDPYSAALDIKAKYQVNANLSDLDESFLVDKDLTRTNVPVNAVLMAKGDMRQPDVSFDLDFPTLNSDVYRKVRSIVSTEDMMNRQIIYLLALNRFYTPEYMSTTKGNELFSVASSTIASQLSSMLGKLSENWSIAPNLRSDRGDFSDVEVDVALSSTLLNNRLRLNGNFGYRDKSLNSNQFIGDFDIEYLLTPRGTWRLKAYNRYNDQNYYLRSAQTTQGVGIMFKRDFDNMFNFLRPKRKKADVEQPKSVGSDTTAVPGPVHDVQNTDTDSNTSTIGLKDNP